MTIAIGEHFEAFIGRRVNEGRYGSASDVVRAALRLLEEREMRNEALRAALFEGEQNGVSTPFDVEEYFFSKSKRRPASKRPEIDDEIPF